MVTKEGRLSRWSRLKQKGGAGEVEEKIISAERNRLSEDRGDREAAQSHDNVMTAPDPQGLPGGDFRHSNIPPMAPLGGVEDADTEFESAPRDALALLGGTNAPDGAVSVAPVDGISEHLDEAERELSPQEEEVVAGLPAIDSLTPDSDFTPFLADRVPEFIRRRALSVLWRSNPVFANLDGLNDYDEDFNIIDKLINIAKDSSYRVGKGYASDDEDEGEEDETQQKVAEDQVTAPVEDYDVAADGTAGERSLDEETDMRSVDENIRDDGKSGD